MEINNPFISKKTGELKFPWRPIRDIVFLLPFPEKKKYCNKGKIIIPQDHREYYKRSQGMVLAVGPGYYDKKKKRFIKTNPDLKIGIHVYFDKDVPWCIEVEGQDGKDHPVIICGAQDIWMINEY